ncbi:MAG: NAD-dependent epimerase/dehydratase family protein [Jatrophihabitans sp.]|uniref:NAD-dependent epimerase/dehydratase family protein n=1 Tax=Jatrophihabitans sp. TaxID=1932789 RepID=UPI0039134B2B
MRVLLTGGAGFIGTHVLAALRGGGHDVVVLDSLRADVHRGPAPVIDGLVVGDVRDAAAVDSALRGADAVVHLAAKVGLGVDVQDLPDYAGSNDHGTAILLAAMARAGVARLVLASSMVVYGEGVGHCGTHGDVRPGPRAEAALAAGEFEPPCPVCGEALAPALVSEDAPLDPRNGYAASKLAQEHLAASWARATGGSVAALRYHNVYGPGLPMNTPYAGVAAIFLSALRQGIAPRVNEDGGMRRDFVHVRDVAAATVAALHHGGGVRAYNVGSGTPRTVGELAAALADAVGGPAPMVSGDYRLGDVRHITADSSRLRAELGWAPQVDFAAGLAELAGSGQ